MTQIKVSLSLVLAIGLVCAAQSLPQSNGRRVDFVRDIQPIFEKSCYSCHGAQKQMARLRLDSKEAALRGGVSGSVIAPGLGQESLLYIRVAGLDGLEQMPQKGEELPPEQIELIRRWIDQGAQWPEQASTPAAEVKKHWAYEKPVRHEPPSVRDSAWVRNPIDHFILARLEKERLQPSREASKETLIRRVTLDLTGLPPAIAETEAFLADNSPEAYEKVVDRLLASPHYGERWARPWLDLARYADTHGYEKDRRRSMWLYRDWIIRALNADMPFDQFTIEQIAGDLLPNATTDQKIATGFHRNTMINEEGGIDPEEFRVAAIVDRVDTTASMWLGTTLACAQCHNHKYDPFTQEEYYRFFAFFNNSEDEVEIVQRTERRSGGPSLALPAPEYLAAHRRDVEDQILVLEKVLNAPTPELEAAQAKWERELLETLVAWEPLYLHSYISAGGASLIDLADGSLLAGARNPERDTYVVVASTVLPKVTGIRLEALTHSSLPQGGSGRSTTGNFVLTGIEVQAAPLDRPDQWQRVVISNAVAEYSQRGFSIKDAVDPDAQKGWAIDGDKPELRVDRRAAFEFEQPVSHPKGTVLTIRLRHESELARHVIGRFRLLATQAQEPGKGIALPMRLEPVLATPAHQRTTEQKKALGDHYRTIAPQLKPLREELAQLRDVWKELSEPTTLVMKDREEPRKTQVHIRGNFLDKGKQVTPGVPAVLHELAEDAPLNRLALARWLVNENNPLVTRVTLNRFWMEFFGRGLVSTPEDFGTRGDPPTHPELLDWLATEFMGRRWSVKAVHRLIVTSATYRQSSEVRPELLERDPYNKLLARAPRFRLEAELVRDATLAIAGLLSPKMFGPSVFPPAPEGVWNVVYNDDKWITSRGQDRYRRGIYTFWRRTAPYPQFVTFDAPSRETVCLARGRTNTPLQSLTTLNDPAFFDAARSLARRIVTESTSPDIRERIGYAFRLCVARRPDTNEIDRLAALFAEELKYYRNNPAATQKVCTSGEIDAPDQADAAEFAAWTIVANVLLNLDETLTKG